MIAVLLNIILILIHICESESIIKTQHDNIQGIEKRFEEGIVTEYLGVTFARITSKRKRFMPLSELRKSEWKGVFHAKTKAVSCYQHLIKFDFEPLDAVNPSNKISENCLQLNMWVPKIRSGAVFVVIHGGSFTRGSPH